jgi:uncharacterized oxidoreductase
MKLSGNTIFITGGGSGIGRGLAEALHKLGNKVIIAGRRRSHLDAVTAANPGMEAVELDITDPTSINQVAAKLIAAYPDLNVLINNAGIMQPDAAAGKIDDALMVATITTNLMGPIRMTSALIEHLKPEECHLLMSHADGVIGEMILMALRTGMRQGELKGLQWSSIDWQNMNVTVRHSRCDRARDIASPKNNRRVRK